MRVKSKLFLNSLITIFGIVLIGGGSLLGMKFVQGKLSLLTEKSTPFQLRTIELQRSLQEHTSNLLKTAATTSLPELTAARGAAEKTLAEAKSNSEKVATLRGAAGENAGLAELETITRDIFSTTEARIKAEEGAKAADVQMKAKLQGISQKLRSLDTSVKRVQKSSMAQLNTSNESVKRITKRVKNVQAAMNSLNDIKISLLEIAGAESKAGVTLGKSHFTVASRWVVQGELAKSEKDSAAVKELVEGVNEIGKKVTGPQGLVELKNAILSTPDEEAKKNFKETYATAMQKLAQLTVIMGDLVERSGELFAAENRKFDDSLKGSETAGTKLSSNSELVALGAEINTTANEMFSVRTLKELEAFRADIDRKFGQAGAIQKRIASGKGEEARLIGQVSASLGEIRSLLFGADGAWDKLRLKLEIEQKAQQLNGKLKDLVAKQREEGLKGVTAAQGEQEKAVGSVNGMVRTFVTAVSIVGIAVLVFGILFSQILARSITAPIAELRVIAEAFGAGDFSKQMNAGRRDEFGELAVHFNTATAKVSEITTRLAASIQVLASQSSQLSTTAEEVTGGARDQAMQTAQSASAMTEMTQTIDEVAGNAVAAADASRQALDTAAEGSSVVARTVEGMDKIAASVRDAAAVIAELGESSDKIGEIVNVINDIADQTNLLALNAAIEAARAGEVGMGFAVVANEVRNLAKRTTDSTAEIAAVVREIQAGMSRSVAAMEAGNQNVEEGVRLAEGAKASLTAIVEASERGASMVERIATAAEEQSATANEVSSNVEGIAEITRRNEAAMAEIARASMELSRITSELSAMASWFKTAAA